MGEGRRQKRAKPPLDEAHLRDLALHYVGRYATSRGKLRAYLHRKLRERGWDGDSPAPVDAMIERFAELGYVDDAAFAAAKARDLSARGYGARRLGQTLYAAGISEEDGAQARDIAEEAKLEAAMAFARRRRLGPFAQQEVEDPALRQKQLAAMMRAGHDFALARRILALEPGQEIETDI
ncbi:regulatory protein RecX [Sphingomicrobium flavum]|uniref:regulatory protein RecX n=1 Tax=Sphingomicrobium flavum TaxID=1229164 RepID=UPI0021AE06D8|nr:RecX family transcriptional regulator [Sphingomicrobium flavum]